MMYFKSDFTAMYLCFVIFVIIAYVSAGLTGDPRDSKKEVEEGDEYYTSFNESDEDRDYIFSDYKYRDKRLSREDYDKYRKYYPAYYNQSTDEILSEAESSRKECCRKLQAKRSQQQAKTTASQKYAVTDNYSSLSNDGVGQFVVDTAKCLGDICLRNNCFCVNSGNNFCGNCVGDQSCDCQCCIIEDTRCCDNCQGIECDCKDCFDPKNCQGIDCDCKDCLDPRGCDCKCDGIDCTDCLDPNNCFNP